MRAGPSPAVERKSFKSDGSILDPLWISDPEKRFRLLPAKWGLTRREAGYVVGHYPRELMALRMEAPADWLEAGRIAAYTLAERVLACILYHSWCWPVCMEYAVQLAGRWRCHREGPPFYEGGNDSILFDQVERPLPLRQKDIARILGATQPAVSRAMQKLGSTPRKIRIDEDHVISPSELLLAASVFKPLLISELISTKAAR